jgi:ABC-type transport system involved in cytochrome c biogenesis ATPase subunit
LRKNNLVERILIDPASFAITHYDATGHGLAKQRLSDGEKQIFAIAVLWGLVRASARPLPAVIDTPMARLDVAQRLVRQFRLHLHRGIGPLATPYAVRSIADLIFPAGCAGDSIGCAGRQ